MPRLLRALVSPTTFLVAAVAWGAYLVESTRGPGDDDPNLAAAGAVYVLAYAPDGSNLAWAGLHDRIWLCRPTTGESAGALADEVVRTSALAYAPDGHSLATAAVDRQHRPWDITIWDVATGEILASLGGHTDQVTDLAYSADGSALASTSLDGTVRIWDAATGTLVASSRVDGRPFYRVAFEPGDRTLLTAGDDGRVRRWDARDGQPRGVAVAANEPIRCMALSHDGTTLATWEIGRLDIKLWDVATGRFKAAAHGHTNYLQALRFAPTGLLLASASLDGTVRLWDGDTAEPRAVLEPAAAGGVYSLAFAPDGGALAVGGKTARVGIYDLARVRAGDGSAARGVIQLSRR